MVKVFVVVLSRVQLFETLQTCSSPGSSVHGIHQAKTLEWVAISFSRGSSLSRDRTCVSCVSCTGRQILYHCTTWETKGKTKLLTWSICFKAIRCWRIRWGPYEEGANCLYAYVIPREMPHSTYTAPSFTHQTLIEDLVYAQNCWRGSRSGQNK